MENRPTVNWDETEKVRGGDTISVNGKALPFGKVKVTVKVIPSNVASNVYEVEADMRGAFGVAVKIPAAPASPGSQALVVVSAFGLSETTSHSYHYLG